MRNKEFWEQALTSSAVVCRCPTCKCVATYYGSPDTINTAMERFYALHSRCQKVEPSEKKAIFCEHANEVPASCPCNLDCYCKEHTCKPKDIYCPKDGTVLSDGRCYRCDLNKQPVKDSFFDNTEKVKKPVQKCTRSYGHDGPCNGMPCDWRISQMPRPNRVKQSFREVIDELFKDFGKDDVP